VQDDFASTCDPSPRALRVANIQSPDSCKHRLTNLLTKMNNSLETIERVAAQPLSCLPSCNPSPPSPPLPPLPSTPPLLPPPTSPPSPPLPSLPLSPPPPRPPPPSPPPEPPMENFALSSKGATATASGRGCYAGYCANAAEAIDNSSSTFWSDSGCQTSRPRFSPYWLLVDMGEMVDVRRVRVTFRHNSIFSIALSNSSLGPFQTVATQTCQPSCVHVSMVVPNSPFHANLTTPVTARFAKMTATYAGGAWYDVDGNVKWGCGRDCCLWALNVQEFEVWGYEV